MLDILLISEDMVKKITCISDNVAGKYLCPSIREAQDFTLKRILGAKLTEKLKDLVDKSALDQNPDYKELLQQCRYVLAYGAIVQLYDNITYKVSNFGVNKATDDHIESAQVDDYLREQTKFQSKCDAYTYDLQNYLLDNKSKFPELDEGKCREIRSNLHHTASCGFWLGGVRGKMIR